MYRHVSALGRKILSSEKIAFVCPQIIHLVIPSKVSIRQVRFLLFCGVSKEGLEARWPQGGVSPVPGEVPGTRPANCR